MSEHVVSLKTNVAVWVALAGLDRRDHRHRLRRSGTIEHDRGPGHCHLQSLLVVLIFMHVKYASDKLVKVVVISAVFFLLLLLGLSLADYSTRML